MNQIVVPTGYMGSGSSAVTNIVSEIRGYEINDDSYEFVLLHCPDGLFDLEDKLLVGNNAIRSDEAIHRFLCCMKDLYRKKNYWVSGYDNKISLDFMNYCTAFVDELTDFSSNEVYWYFQQNPKSFGMYLKNYYRRIVGKLTRGKVRVQRPVLYPTMTIAMPSEDQFYIAAKRFLSDIFEALGLKEHNLVLDQFLLPHNLHRVEKYFDENLRVTVVDRDPRDVFLLNKYVWKPQGVAVPYPTEINEFCCYYRKLRQTEINISDSRILRLHFEDLVYNYEEEVKKIYFFLEVDANDHIHRFKIFNPSKSINNTQLFMMKDRFPEDVSIIEKLLPEFIYPFPEKLSENKTSGEFFFDLLVINYKYHFY